MKLQIRRPGRLAAGVLAGALALSTSPFVGGGIAGAADTLPAPANPLAPGAFCDGAPDSNPFTDLGAEVSATRETILCLVATGVTSGVTSTRYVPGGNVTRRQMALFIKRLADLANELEVTGLTSLPAYDGTEDYSDTAAESTAVKEAVGQLSQAGIVQGTSATRYSPSALVTRRQMAAFVNRLQEYLTGSKFTSTGNYFDDDDGDPGESDLNAVAEAGIFQGDGAGRVFPGASLTRRQMANILMRDAQAMLNNGDIRRPFETQTLDVKPTAQATLPFVANPEAGSNSTDDRMYTAEGLQPGLTYKIALFPAANIVSTSNGLTLVDANSDNLADGVAVPKSKIVVVNGGVNSQPIASAQPVNGTISFTVDGDGPTESVAPVVWLDNGAQTNQLELVAPASPNADPKKATEPSGAGGAIHYVPDEAGFGDHTGSDVATVNLASDYFVGQTDTEHPSASETFYYDQADVFRYLGNGISFAQFESMLSPGDVVTVNYAQDSSGVSIFNITADAAPVAPSIKSIAVRNADGGASANDVDVTFTPPANNAAGVVYTLEQRSDTQGETDPDAPPNPGNPPYPNAPPICSNGVSSWTAWAPTSTTYRTNPNGTATLSRPNAADGCHDYRITAKNPVSATTATGPAWTTNPSTVGVQVPATGAPLSVSMTQTNGGTGTGAVAASLDRSDTIQIVFDRAMNAAGSIRFTDGDGTVVEVSCGAEAPFAACAVNADPTVAGGAVREPRRVLSITLRADPTPVAPGSSPDLAVATGVATSHEGVTSDSGVGWNIAASSDKSLA